MNPTPAGARPVVVKIGGNEMDQPGFFDQLAQAIAGLQQRTPCIVVHGGGRAINRLQERLGLQAIYHEGQRVTDEAALEAVEMVLSGVVKQADRARAAARRGGCDRAERRGSRPAGGRAVGAGDGPRGPHRACPHMPAVRAMRAERRPGHLPHLGWAGRHLQRQRRSRRRGDRRRAARGARRLRDQCAGRARGRDDRGGRCPSPKSRA